MVIVTEVFDMATEELVPLRVKIGVKGGPGGRSHAYPDFNRIPAVLRGNMDWCHFIDQYGGWYYDKVSGHDDADDANDSPRGTWLGLLLVPESFADAAIDTFPDECDELDGAEAEAFYENRVSVVQPDVLEDVDVLQAIAAKRAAGIAEDDDDREALKPDSMRRGRRKNPKKKFADVIAKKNVAVKNRQKRPKPARKKGV